MMDIATVEAKTLFSARLFGRRFYIVRIYDGLGQRRLRAFVV